MKKMELLTSNVFKDFFEGFIHLPKQSTKFSLDLTVKNIFEIKGNGSLDFGGSEYRSGNKVRINPIFENDPKYGWWTLEEGMYIVEYNEKLKKNVVLVLIYPHSRLLLAGGSHSSFILKNHKDPIFGLLVVHHSGLRIKENSRISTAIVLAE